MTGKTRYLTVLYHRGEPTWFVLDKPPAGLPQATTRLKIGSHYYFLTAEPPLIDAESGTTVIFVQALTHHSLWSNTINPEGAVYELTKVDPNDFQADAHWRQVDNPFTDLA
jgi:hypothetical protein